MVSHVCRWQAEGFLAGHCLGVGGGITFGVSKADTVIILNTERALAQYQSRDMNFKFGEDKTRSVMVHIACPCCISHVWWIA